MKKARKFVPFILVVSAAAGGIATHAQPPDTSAALAPDTTEVQFSDTLRTQTAEDTSATFVDTTEALPADSLTVTVPDTVSIVPPDTLAAEPVDSAAVQIPDTTVAQNPDTSAVQVPGETVQPQDTTDQQPAGTLTVEPADTVLTPSDVQPDTTSITEKIQEAAIPQAPVEPPDTSAPPPLSPVSFRLTDREYNRHLPKDAGETLALAPGYFPRHPDLYGHPFQIVPSGGTPRDMVTWLHSRPYDEPVTGATNFTTLVPEGIQIAEYSRTSVAGIPSSGPVLRIIQPYLYPEIPRTRVVYRQGWYGIGRADWRIAQQVTNSFAYHIGVNISEFQGRYFNTYSNSSHLRLGARQTFRGVGHLFVQWMETRAAWGKEFDYVKASLHRNDIDAILFSGQPGDSLYRELGAWYVRSTNGYARGDDDGNRLGVRAEMGGIWGNQYLKGRLDAERIAARFPRRRLNTDPQADRITAGVSLLDDLKTGRFELQAALRAEYSSVSTSSDSTDVDPEFRTGGSLTASWRLVDSLQVIGAASSSWRYPSLDEIGGFWSVNTPYRWMDLFPVPDSTLFYRGNPNLNTVRTEYAGGGLKWIGNDYKQVQLMAGIRRWSDQIIAVQLDQANWSRTNLEPYERLETTFYGWTPVFGPISLAGSATWAERMLSNAPVPELSGWGSLRYRDYFYNGQLRVNVSVNAYYWGPYDTGTFDQPEKWMLEGIFNARVFDFEIYYGVRNPLSVSYHFIPFYPNMHRDEIWGVRWVLFK